MTFIKLPPKKDAPCKPVISSDKVVEYQRKFNKLQWGWEACEESEATHVVIDIGGNRFQRKSLA